MADLLRPTSIEDLPSHLIVEILSCGKLSVVDLVCLELVSRAFRGSHHGLFPPSFRSLVDFAAFQLCGSHPIYAPMSPNARNGVFNRCRGNWKRVLRFLQSVEQSSNVVETSLGNVFTCGDNSSFFCGHRDVGRPRLVDALRGIPCKQVATGLSFTIFLTRQGHVYTCGANSHGQLGHGDTNDRPIPTIVEPLESVGAIAQIAAGPSYSLVITDDGTIHSFGSGANFCLGHGLQRNELQPRPIQSFIRQDIHIVRVSAGDEHVVALDSSGFVYTWGKGYCGALGHGDEVDKTTPELLYSLRSHVAVQVCASKRKTFVLVDDGSVYGFGWMAFGSLGFTDRGASDKITKPRILDSLRPYHISQVSTGLYHTVVVTNRGQIFGFGDNERAQLGHDTLRGCLRPTEIFVPEMENNAGFVSETG
ncbi:ultraviolet-B receptor UVR8 isoform X3 [Rhododendron vialii]|uniref:ultraviolet-B receptor UVR8 isoform X3 n=1 Tax=Rhododendron vialii TaxID=182163 RepID=UPI00265D694E|nr:ultraviolet-B receptor UVR8 isoform X3 [Rhododendron vialii]